MNTIWEEKNYTERETNYSGSNAQGLNVTTQKTERDSIENEWKDTGGIKQIKTCKNKKLTTKIFVRRCKEMHRDLYDYSKTEYVNSHKKVLIICKIHGLFSQLAYHHIQGHGCSKCKGEFIGNSKRLNAVEVLKDASRVHKNKYDYSKAIYKSKHDKMRIVCPLHGVFLQKPGNHLR
jgi:hypothetical protein